MILGNVVVILFGMLLLWFDCWTGVLQRKARELRSD